MYSLGIDIGYSSLKLSLINSDNEIAYDMYALHKGSINSTLRKSLEALLLKYDPKDIAFGAAIGSGSRFLIKTGKIGSANEVAAIVEGCISTHEDIGSIIEIGGQNAKYITDFAGEDKSRIKISANSNCSAGTGSFLEEQVSRLNLKLEDYAPYAGRGKSVPRIAGRCSVFAKTDITHHQQEGVPTEDILLGLAYAMVRNYRGAVMKKLPMKKPVVFAGGVAYNQAIIRALEDVLNLKKEELIIPEHFSTIGAFGAALIAGREKIKINVEQLLGATDDDFSEEDDTRVHLPALISFGTNDSIGKHDDKPANHDTDCLECFLGIDVGSTSTNLVLTDRNNHIVCFKYLRTMGNPVEAVTKGLKEIQTEFGHRISIAGVGTTGSGRHMIGRLVGADVVKDEITSQAKAAVTIDSSVDTIFEIGGQDSKYISLKEGAVTDFQMNKICAAGTGSFIEEQANKFNIPINDFGNIALGSDTPINLGERCTVFIETSIAAHLARGSDVKDIASGLCYSVVKNYLNRVAGQKKIGNKIFFQGGVAYNQGVLNAFRAITGREISVPPFFSVTGAYGAAILAGEEMVSGKTRFRGFEIEPKEASLKIREPSEPKINNAQRFNRQTEELIFKGYDGVTDNSKKTVGIPRALFTFGMFPMFYTFFKELGFNVLLSDPTSEDTIRLGQEYSLGEACYPVKLINGHVAELVQKNVDYIFFPDLYTVDHPGSQSRQNYGCAYMQLAFKVISQAMELSSKGIELLAPTIAFSLGKEFMMKSFSALGKQLGTAPEQTFNALGKGMMAFHQFEERIQKYGKEVVSQIRPDEKAFVIISKIYGVADPVLNMGIPGKLMDMGYKVAGFYDLPEGDIFGEHPNMYWPFVQHILDPAYLIKQHPNLYAVLLTHHGCGPDSLVTHYFREIMDGKPYLNIEVDEHSSDVGVITRIEAFVNSLPREDVQKADDMETYLQSIVHEKVNIKTDMAELKTGTPLCLPHMYPYSQVFEKMLASRGTNARVLPETNQESVDIGRKHTLTNEYLSLTALLGDVLRELGTEQRHKDGIAFFIPQTEGAETDGQANRFVRTKLDAEGYGNADILAPFIEDALGKSREDLKRIFLGLLGGDLVRLATATHRDKYLKKLSDRIRSNGLEIDDLTDMGKEIRHELREMKAGGKRILAIGEPFILYNDFLNNFSFRDIEDKGHRVVYSPFSEYVWVMWRDFLDQNKSKTTQSMEEGLDEFGRHITAVSESLSDESPFEKDLENLIMTADKTIGYYAGAFGRYRAAKILSDLNGTHGIITAASMYENTQISLDILHKGFENSHSAPVLNLSFDGNRNENDKMKIESFIYYL
ncbi:acyl-CoA dehydratase activase [Desulfonema magnum]|uniref:CoA enzyme activase domain-containing protein n=1 Tax=Desulfonema magnum TaxID=45655 RepID=A0A975GSZ1_9BACT|nr:acyl-CoA dehydratase activase [Desulfonema magnum]QTA92565.1 CoA enzyme activase domain-containing protein [Desulfonema magnum]